MPTENACLFPPPLACSLPPGLRRLAGLRELSVVNGAERYNDEWGVPEVQEWIGCDWGSGSLSSLTALTGLALFPGAFLPGKLCGMLLPCWCWRPAVLH